MNILILREPEKTSPFCEELAARKRPGTHITTAIVGEDYETARYTLRNLRWDVEGAPSAIVCHIPGILKNDFDIIRNRLDVASEMAGRQTAVLFVLVPHLETDVQANYIRKKTDWLLTRSSNVFVLHGMSFEDHPREMVDLVLKLVNSGMFGAYRIVCTGNGTRRGWEVRPVLKHHSLVPPKIEEAQA